MNKKETREGFALIVIIILITSVVLVGGGILIYRRELAKQSAIKEVWPYSDAKNDFSICIPDEFKKVESMQGTIASFEDEHGQITIAKTSREGSLDDYFPVIEKRIKSAMPNYLFISKDSLTINNLPALEHQFEYPLQGIGRKNLVFYIQKGNSVFIITYVTKKELYSLYVNKFDQSAKTFSSPRKVKDVCGRAQGKDEEEFMVQPFDEQQSEKTEDGYLIGVEKEVLTSEKKHVPECECGRRRVGAGCQKEPFCDCLTGKWMCEVCEAIWPYDHWEKTVCDVSWDPLSPGECKKQWELRHEGWEEFCLSYAEWKW